MRVLHYSADDVINMIDANQPKLIQSDAKRIGMPVGKNGTLEVQHFDNPTGYLLIDQLRGVAVALTEEQYKQWAGGVDS